MLGGKTLYTVVQLDLVDGNLFWYPTGINDNNVVIGVCYQPDGSSVDGVIASVGSTESPVGYMSTSFMMLSGINNPGTVAGTILTEGEIRAYTYTPECCDESLNVFGGDTMCRAINNSGQICGTSYVAPPELQIPTAYVYPGPNLGSWSGGATYANDINDNGVVVGQGYPGNSPNSVAIMWTTNSGPQWPAVVPKLVGSLGGSQCEAIAVNNSNQVVGNGTIGVDAEGEQIYRAFYWQNGVIVQIGTFGGKSSFALGINDAGVVLGIAQDKNEKYQPFVWTRGGEMQDLLSQIVGTPLDAFKPAAINRAGVIAGTAVYGDQVVPVLLMPFVEPPTPMSAAD